MFMIEKLEGYPSVQIIMIYQESFEIKKSIMYSLIVIERYIMLNKS